MKTTDEGGLRKKTHLHPASTLDPERQRCPPPAWLAAPPPSDAAAGRRTEPEPPWSPRPVAPPSVWASSWPAGLSWRSLSSWCLRSRHCREKRLLESEIQWMFCCFLHRNAPDSHCWGNTVVLLRLPLHSLQQLRRSDTHVCGAALQVGSATLLGLELLATDGAVWDTRGSKRRRRRWSTFFTLIQTPADENYFYITYILFSWLYYVFI